MMSLALGGVALAAAVFYFLPRAGQIAVNVADSKGSAIPHLAIYVDGKKQCESAPCIVSDVTAGSHTVRVEASGFEPPADKAVAVESRKNTTVDFGLAPLASGTVNGGAGPPISFDDVQAEKAFTVVPDRKTPTGAAPRAAQTERAAAAAGQAFLNINSIPVSSITLDGKPIGTTPKSKYRISPGTHSVVFANPAQGFQKQISVTVAAGETKTAIGRN